MEIPGVKSGWKRKMKSGLSTDVKEMWTHQKSARLSKKHWCLHLGTTNQFIFWVIGVCSREKKAFFISKSGHFIRKKNCLFVNVHFFHLNKKNLFSLVCVSPLICLLVSLPFLPLRIPFLRAQVKKGNKDRQKRISRWKPFLEILAKCQNEKLP